MTIRKTQYEMWHEQAALEERARIVAHLNAKAEATTDGHEAATIYGTAREIEAGEHLK